MQFSLLKSLDRVSDASKLQMLAPLVEEVLRKSVVDPEDQAVDTLLFGVIDKSAVKELNDESNETWTALLSSFDAPRSPGQCRSRPTNTLCSF